MRTYTVHPYQGRLKGGGVKYFKFDIEMIRPNILKLTRKFRFPDPDPHSDSRICWIWILFNCRLDPNMVFSPVWDPKSFDEERISGIIRPETVKYYVYIQLRKHNSLSLLKRLLNASGLGF